MLGEIGQDFVKLLFLTRSAQQETVRINCILIAKKYFRFGSSAALVEQEGGRTQCDHWHQSYYLHYYHIDEIGHNKYFPLQSWQVKHILQH